MKVVVHLFQLHQITPVIALVLVIKDSIALLFVSTEIHQIVTIFFLPIVLPDIDISLSSTQVVILEVMIYLLIVLFLLMYLILYGRMKMVV